MEVGSVPYSYARRGQPRMLEQYDQITAACEAIQKRWPDKPKVGIILGSGLGNATQGVTVRVEIP